MIEHGRCGMTARERIVCALTVCALMILTIDGAHEQRQVHEARCAVGHLGEPRCGDAR